jgi:hypothetical protein
MAADEPQVMPNDEELREWIKEYGHVYHVLVDDCLYFFRRLTRREYQLVLQIDDECERSDEVCETCMLWPKDFKVDDAGPAGTPEVLCEHILKASGCVNLRETQLAYATNIATDIESQMEAIIDHAFGGSGNFARYKDWSHDQLCDAFAKAKFITENIMGRPINLEDDQKPQKRRRRSLSDRPDEIFERIKEPQPEMQTGVDGDLGSIPRDFDTGKMANRPIGEVMEKYNRTQRMLKLRKAMAEKQGK